MPLHNTKILKGETLAVFINPVIKVIDDKRQNFWEGCLSVPGLRGLVGRPTKSFCGILDENGNQQKLNRGRFRCNGRST
jgi:peptide deformylase